MIGGKEIQNNEHNRCLHGKMWVNSVHLNNNSFHPCLAVKSGKLCYTRLKQATFTTTLGPHWDIMNSIEVNK